MKYDFNFHVTAISMNPFKRNAELLRNRLEPEEDGKNPAMPVFLVPDSSNKVDPNAIQVMAQTPMGRVSLGYVPARRYCPICDPGQEKRGISSYTGAENCPECGTKLGLAKTEQILPLLKEDGVVQSCNAIFIGGTTEKANIGAIVRCVITVP